MNDEFFSWYEKWIKENAEAYLSGFIKEDWTEFKNIITVFYKNGKGPDRLDFSGMQPVIAPDRFVQTWTSLPRDRELDLVPLFEERYKDKKEFLCAEGPWWKDVRNELRICKEEEKFRPGKVQIAYLIDQVDKKILSLRDEDF